MDNLTGADLSVLLVEYFSLHPEWRDRWRALFLFDEIQMVKGWERFTRRLLDTENIELFFSGSSAVISGGLPQPGRYDAFPRLKPFF
ncbi:MAG: AAA family ATPase [Deltaproteobacteria bacterium]|nr:AAA family ATPase [Deltaproteobacteria bacterium]MBW2154294.1 AAA family ATPase [Deltaproteobacteria bacterium]